MDELEFRRRLYADPNELDEQLSSYVAQDAQREKLVADLQSLDKRLEQALNIEVPDNLAERIILNQSFSEHRSQKRRARAHLAIAASVAFAFGIIFNLYNSAAPLNLEQHALDHLYHEIASIKMQDRRFDLNQVNAKLASFGGQLNELPGEISFLTICDFKGQKGLHLVFNSATGPVTLFIVPQDNTRESVSEFSDQQFKGTILQTHFANVIMLAEKADNLPKYQQQVKENLMWKI
ncbi:DUF3379 family protein [Pseudoalteromonas tunicata]|jgi:hypothetical protein|uniref:Uncharacterized protein n=1 Tax=Pseudoalteromonas tunicata D2 TaxID=87626 RepID=A4C691_9GAMM|nr:DUF3379 family protein [Pseudoalteromonas tunicata]ATC95469.1 hypothetical protein PTUN_a3082 [Pseudoalteromonas tunicata]AXT31044.1 DUF3379 domain-containing protein [Pseudoalteromonas tunicata]EAR29495.1 hypothetical protein PTD2_11784 [Pseudoalteromonas tunicata D2]MDP4985513.1 DUF3379 domain-containing protein [Pseudoalteromonas tunicata]MDP5212399.1 DUF3379 family protein [Pseudoalteromonas tunicata]